MNASGGNTGMGNESRVTCMKLCMVDLPQIRCQLHDHVKQYDNDEACHNKRNSGKLHGNIVSASSATPSWFWSIDDKPG